jgi:chromate reductase, NAD(P)H dehydrogenase (quinone)
MFNEDLEVQGTPLAVQALAEAVTRCAGLIVSTPEYNHGVPGVLKNALDWLSRAPGKPLVGKPVCVMGATTGAWGTRLAQAMLRQSLFACQARVIPMASVCLPLAATAFDEQGVLIDKAVEQALERQLSGFSSWIEQAGA